jgi:phosphoinositide-3-kinase regulatory subunit 4
MGQQRVVSKNTLHCLNLIIRIDGPALIILALVCANVRNCSQPSSKLRALDVFLALSVHLTDEAKLDRLVPYIVDLLRDDVAAVRAAALRTLLQVVSIFTQNM